MTKLQFFVIALFLLLIGTGFPASLSALEFTSSELSALSSGKLVCKPLSTSRQNGFYGGTGFALVDASPEVIWRFLEDWRAYPDAFPRTVEAREVSQKERRSLIRMRLGYKLLSVKYFLSVDRDWKQKTITFNLAKSRPHDIHATRGYWRLLPQPDGRTLVAYGIAVQLPMGIVAFLGDKLEREMEKDLIGLPKYLKRYVEGKKGIEYHQLTARADKTGTR